jgi:hypothetical protein
MTQVAGHVREMKVRRADELYRRRAEQRIVLLAHEACILWKNELDLIRMRRG